MLVCWTLSMQEKRFISLDYMLPCCICATAINKILGLVSFSLLNMKWNKQTILQLNGGYCQAWVTVLSLIVYNRLQFTLIYLRARLEDSRVPKKRNTQPRLLSWNDPAWHLSLSPALAAWAECSSFFLP